MIPSDVIQELFDQLIGPGPLAAQITAARQLYDLPVSETEVPPDVLKKAVDRSFKGLPKRRKGIANLIRGRSSTEARRILQDDHKSKVQTSPFWLLAAVALRTHGLTLPQQRRVVAEFHVLAPLLGAPSMIEVLSGRDVVQACLDYEFLLSDEDAETVLKRLSCYSRTVLRSLIAFPDPRVDKHRVSLVMGHLGPVASLPAAIILRALYEGAASAQTEAWVVARLEQTSAGRARRLLLAALTWIDPDPTLHVPDENDRRGVFMGHLLRCTHASSDKALSSYRELCTSFGEHADEIRTAMSDLRAHYGEVRRFSPRFKRPSLDVEWSARIRELGRFSIDRTLLEGVIVPDESQLRCCVDCLGLSRTGRSSSPAPGLVPYPRYASPNTVSETILRCATCGLPYVVTTSEADDDPMMGPAESPRFRHERLLPDDKRLKSDIDWSHSVQRLTAELGHVSEHVRADAEWWLTAYTLHVDRRA